MSDTKIKILIVDDEIENLKALERTLRGKYDVVSCSRPEDALKALENEVFSVVISDQRMPGMLGTDFLAKAAIQQPLMTRIILTAYSDSKEILDAINRAEIYRYVLKPWDNAELLVNLHQAVEHSNLRRKNAALIQELERMNRDLEKTVNERTQELKDANERLSELAMTDPLTKVLNRRAFFAKLNDEIERSRRYKHAIAIAMIDIDHFKEFNDMEGHVYGDGALRKVAQTFVGNIRKIDSLARYGGEEFILMMPETPPKQALEICERLRGSIENAVFQGRQDVAYLTVSIGLSAFPEGGDTAEALVKSADLSLYEAKGLGRNQVIHSKGNASFFVSRQDGDEF